jgi:hypothetical protein
MFKNLNDLCTNITLPTREIKWNTIKLIDSGDKRKKQVTNNDIKKFKMLMNALQEAKWINFNWVNSIYIYIHL